MKVSKGYKQTEVGVIPEDWDAYPVGDIVNYLKGFPFRAVDYKSHGVRILRVSDTTYDQIKEEGIYIDAFEAKRYRKWGLRGGDLVVSTVGSKPPMYDSMVGKVTFISEQHAGTLLNQNAVVLRSESRSRQRMIQYNLRQERYISHIKGIFRGNANQASITLRELFDFQIPLPPTLAEQEAIAGALSDADAWIESLEQLIDKKRQIKQGAMQELLTGKRRLPGFSGEWETKRLGEIGSCYRGVSYNPATDLSSCDTQSTIRLLRSNNVQDSTIVFEDMQFVASLRVYSEQYLQENDILICMANGSRDLVGKAGRFKNPNDATYTFGAFMGVFRPSIELAHPVFTFYLFRTQAYRRHIAILLAGSSINNLTTDNLESHLVSIPRAIEEQTAIATVLSDMDSEIDSLESKLAKAREIKQGMMQELLTGRIRII
jgi:type I restriction enzyme S subunit